MHEEPPFVHLFLLPFPLVPHNRLLYCFPGHRHRLLHRNPGSRCHLLHLLHCDLLNYANRRIRCRRRELFPRLHQLLSLFLCPFRFLRLTGIAPKMRLPQILNLREALPPGPNLWYTQPRKTGRAA